MYKHFFKRLIDLCLSSFALLVVSPFFIVIIILIKIESRGKVFFMQERVGLNGNIFHLFKFRTMTDVYRDPSKAQTYQDNPEITRVGYYLRRFKIDELPQLINVFLGDMSIIGPRPALPSLYEQYGDVAKKRLEVRPGLSGLSQIRGNIFLPWEKRFIYDQEYIDNISLLTDLKIILKTFSIVIFGEEKFIKK